MTRSTPFTMMLVVALIAASISIHANAQDVPDDVFRAATGQKKPADSAKPVSASTTPSSANNGPPSQSPLIEEDDAIESQLNRAAVRYENLARKWSDGQKGWQQRARETLLRIEALLADPYLALSSDERVLLPDSSAANSTETETNPPDVADDQRTNSKSRPLIARRKPFNVGNPPQELKEEGILPAAVVPAAGTKATGSGEQVQLATPPGPANAPKNNVPKPIPVPATSSAPKRDQNVIDDLARQCEELAEQMRRLADDLRKANKPNR
jgi:hypothetical protein